MTSSGWPPDPAEENGLSVLDATLNFLLSFFRRGNANSPVVGASVQIATTGSWKWTVLPNGFKTSWIVIHHSFGPDRVTRDFDGIKKYHMSYRYKGDIITQEQYWLHQKAGETAGLELPWKNIGYHFVVEKIGDRYEVIAGRAIGEVGAHCHGFNEKSIGICFVGNYDDAPPSSDMLFTGTSLCRQLCKEFLIPIDQVIGHRESYPLLHVPVEKTCPGSKFDMDAFRNQIKGVSI